jgi:hypothetical protein
MTYTVIKDRFEGEVLDLRTVHSARSVLQNAWRNNMNKVVVSREVYNELINEWDGNPEYGNIMIFDGVNQSKCVITLSEAAINKGRLMSC